MRRVAVFIILLFALVAFINAYSAARAHASPQVPPVKTSQM